MGASKGAQFSLISAILFALIAIGFSAFILFWKAPQDDAAQQVAKPATLEQKAAVMQQLNESAIQAQDAAAPHPPANQADPNDANAAAKLRVMQQLQNAK